MMPTWAWVTIGCIWFGVSFMVWACCRVGADADRRRDNAAIQRSIEYRQRDAQWYLDPPMDRPVRQVMMQATYEREALRRARRIQHDNPRMN